MSANNILNLDNNETDEGDDLNQVLPVPEPDSDEDLSVPPMDGMQYLRRVIEEKKKCAGVVVANVERKPQQHTQLPDIPDKKECKSELLFNKAWQLAAIADFSKLRLKMETLLKKIENNSSVMSLRPLMPGRQDEKAWLKVILHQAPDVVMTPTGPSTKFCLAIPQLTLWCLLDYFPDWLEKGAIPMQDGCRWVFCLLACLELPVAPDIYFSLRQIARTLINHRAQIENPESEELPHINLLVCIIGRYFNQTDLADPFL